jgi:chromosome segregation ATPase
MRQIMIALMLSLSLYAEDVIVERMQSVVDEVTQLRKQYEQEKEQNRLCQLRTSDTSKVKTHNDKSDSKLLQLQEENKKLQTENKALQEAHNAFKSLQKKNTIKVNEINSLQRENRRLNDSAQLLIEKNHKLQDQIKKLKSTAAQKKPIKPVVHHTDGISKEKLKKLQKEKTELEATLHQLKKEHSALVHKHEKLARSDKVIECNKPVKTKTNKAASQAPMSVRTQQSAKKCAPCICPDDNVFPKLVMKNEVLPYAQESKKSVRVELVEEKVVPVIHEKGKTYRVKGESPIYNDPHGGIVEIWEDRTSFTSNVTWKKWIKITGYFINQKWQKSDKTLWVHEDHIQKH